MKKPKLHPRLILVAVLLVAGVFGVVYLLQQVSATKLAVADSRQLVTAESRRSTSTDQATFAQLSSLHQELESLFTPFTKEVEFFERLDQLADQFRLTSALRLLREPTAEGPQTLSMELTVTGVFADVVNFTSALQQEPGFLQVREVDINRDTDSGRVRGRIVFTSLWR